MLVFTLTILMVLGGRTAASVKIGRANGGSSSDSLAGETPTMPAEDGFCERRDGAPPFFHPLGTTCAKIELPGVVTKVWNRILSVVLYRPPVGIVALYTVTKLLVMGRFFRLVDVNGKLEKAFSREDRKRLKRRHQGRAFQLENDDTDYQQFGGIERVRQQLCSVSLASILEDDGFGNIDLSDLGVSNNAAEELALDVLQTASSTIDHVYEPGTSMTEYVEQMVKDYSKLEYTMTTRSSSINQIHGKGNKLGQLLRVCAATSEVRLLDAMLRICRDRILESSYRLSKTQTHWKRRVEQLRHNNSVWMRLFLSQQSVDSDRMRLAFAKDAYNREVTRLGDIVQALRSRPAAGSESDRMMAEVTSAIRDDRIERARLSKQLPQQSRRYQFARAIREPISFMKQLWMNRSIRLATSGRRKLSLYSHSDPLTIDGSAASRILLENERNTGEWLDQTNTWCMDARKTICTVLRETQRSSPNAMDFDEARWEELEKSWCVRSYDAVADGNDDDGDGEAYSKDWDKVLGDIKHLSSLQRLGEGKKIRLKDTTFVNWIRQFEFGGLTMAAFQLLVANLMFRYKVLPQVKDAVLKFSDITWSVIEKQIWTPFRELFTEIFSRSKNSFVEDLVADDEQKSLDFMLRDMGFGDGTAATRQEAIQKASRQYESDMATGLIRHALGGRLIRLILIQVQQLKVGLLSAVGTIDVLLQANQVNFRLLTIIPAILFASVGTRLFLRALFNLRAKDLRPITSVHSKMVEHIDRIQDLCLQQQQHEQQSSPSNNRNKDLGQLLLSVHQYLQFLDFISVSGIPKWQCDGIHNSLMDVVMNYDSCNNDNGMQQYLLMNHVKEKHQDLLKNM